jgi:hypothetical protein
VIYPAANLRFRRFGGAPSSLGERAVEFVLWSLVLFPLSHRLGDATQMATKVSASLALKEESNASCKGLSAADSFEYVRRPLAVGVIIFARRSELCDRRTTIPSRSNSKSVALTVFGSDDARLVSSC